MHSLLQDLRFSFRVLGRHRGFTATSILVLALGIGINAGIFTLINSLLLRPRLSTGAPGTIVGLHSLERGASGSSRAFSYPNFEDLRAARGPFTHLAAHNLSMAGVTEGETTRRAMVDIVTANYFDTLGVALTRGRTFTPEEERPGAPASVAIASYSEWARTGFAQDFLGRTTVLNGRPYTVVGVAPRGFGGTTVVVEPDFYVPLSAHDVIEWDLIAGSKKTLDRRDYHRLLLIGRLPPGMSIEAADRDMASIGRRMEEAFPAENARQDLIVRPLSRLNISTSPSDDHQLYGPVALLQGLGGVVLLISCLNLANMMLAHGVSRSKEMAIRQAIGGGRARLVQQLVTEGFVLAVAGGVVGLAAAYLGATLLVGSLTAIMPVTIALQPALDVRVVLATIAFAALATVTFGLWPAVRLSRTDTIRALNDQTGGMGGARRWFSTANLLVTAQMALSLALLILSALFVRAAALGAQANPGFALDRTVHAEVDPGLAGMDESKGREVRRHLLERLQSTPGVEAASAASVIPFGEVSITRRVQSDGPRLRGERARSRAGSSSALGPTSSGPTTSARSASSSSPAVNSRLLTNCPRAASSASSSTSHSPGACFPARTRSAAASSSQQTMTAWPANGRWRSSGWSRRRVTTCSSASPSHTSIWRPGMRTYRPCICTSAPRKGRRRPAWSTWCVVRFVPPLQGCPSFQWRRSKPIATGAFRSGSCAPPHASSSSSAPPRPFSRWSASTASRATSSRDGRGSSACARHLAPRRGTSCARCFVRGCR